MKDAVGKEQLPRRPGRRRFLLNMARTGGGVALFGLGVALYTRQAASLPAQAIRPPGALDERRLPRRLHPLRPVRARLSFRYA